MIEELTESEQLEELAAAAKQCRDAQKAYFRNRTADNFRAALDAEKALDAILEEYFRKNDEQAWIF